MQDLIAVVKYFLFTTSLHQDINLSYENKYKLSEIAQKIKSENNSKSEIIIQKQNELNYNGSFYKILSLPISFQHFEKGLKKTIINVNKQQILAA